MQLITYVSVIVFAVLVAFVSITAVNVLGSASSNAKELAAQTAMNYANEIKASLQNPLDEARSLALTLEGATRTRE